MIDLRHYELRELFRFGREILTMTRAVQELLNSFDLLAESDQLVAFSEIMKRARRFDSPDLDDETLAHVADEFWQIYDAEEAANSHSIGAD
jgi:hypothetical protein